MPSSRPHVIPEVIHALRQLKPQSILDVGVGFGKWGHLFREYTDILAAEQDPDRYHRDHWRVRIDGIEGYAAYLTEMHRFLYNHLWIGDARSLMPTMDSYELIFMGDIIEHLEKEDGRRLLLQAADKASKAVLVTTPKFDTGQPDLCGNELERHRSLWTSRDFKSVPGTVVKTIGGDTLLALILKPGVGPVHFLSSRQDQEQRAGRQRLDLARQAIVDRLPLATPFILIDDEQIRSLLPHTSVFPFLERNGFYWGPPPDDATAISEFERLRTQGAAALAIVWSSFWWLDQYPGFASYLNQACTQIHQDDLLVIFDVRKDTLTGAGYASD